MGSTSSMAQVNIHLLTVKGLYLRINLLNNDRYRANDSCAPMHIRSPRMSPTLALPAVMLVRMRMMAPVQPMATPLVFFHVMGSPRMRNESTMAKMGIEVVTMLALMGEVMLRPMVNRHWLKTTPSRAAPPNSSTSRMGTCSRLANCEATQNSRAAPIMRKLTIDRPSMPWFMASLPTGDISPHMASAANMLRWACKGLLFIAC